MSIRKIVFYGNSILRKKALPVTKIDEKIKEIVNDMIATMQNVPGVGLAANQIGILKQIIVIDMRVKEKNLEPLALLNPKIIFSQGEDSHEEGCLSFPELNFDIKRATHVKVQAINLNGQQIELEEKDYIARILQHEIDHINGVLFIDHINFVRKQLIKKNLKKIEELAKKE